MNKKFCECGCKQEVKNNRRFVHGHQWVVNSNFVNKIRKKNDGRFIFTKEWNKIHNKNKKGKNAWNYKGITGRGSIECKIARNKLINEKGHCEISNMKNEEHKQLFKGRGLVIHHIDENIDNNNHNNLIILRTDLHSEIRDKKLKTRKEIFKYFDVEYLTWNEFNIAVVELYNNLKNIKFDNIYGIPRGGIILAVILSNYLKIPLVLNKEEINKNTLICDDIVETGDTILNNNFQDNFVISLHYMKNNMFVPKLWIFEKINRFIIYPWEPYFKEEVRDGTKVE